MTFNLELLKYMNRYVRIRKDITHQEYRVLGIIWDTEEILIWANKGTIRVPYQDLDLVPEDNDD